MNVFYLKLNGAKVYVDSDIVAEEEKVTLHLTDMTDSNEIKTAFNNLPDLTIYSAIKQDDGRETDEIVYQYFNNVTKLDKIIYSTTSEKYSVIIIEPNELEERLTEAEDVINFLLMGGGE